MELRPFETNYIYVLPPRSCSCAAAALVHATALPLVSLGFAGPLPSYANYSMLNSLLEAQTHIYPDCYSSSEMKCSQTTKVSHTTATLAGKL